MSRLPWMRWVVFSFALWAGLTGTLAAGTIRYALTDLGSSSYRYNYFLEDFDFLVNQELDIRFDPALYATLSNGVVGSGFDLLLLQPNNPPGTFGDYSALALVNHASLAGPFSVDVVFLGAGQPGAQQFYINQLDQQGKWISTVGSGLTRPVSEPIPEPAAWLLTGVGLLAGFAVVGVRRRLGLPARTDR